MFLVNNTLRVKKSSTVYLVSHHINLIKNVCLKLIKHIEIVKNKFPVGAFLCRNKLIWCLTRARKTKKNLCQKTGKGAWTELLLEQLVPSVTFGTREGVDILVVVVAFLARHLRITPDRLGKVRELFGDFLLADFLALVVLHKRSFPKNHDCPTILSEVVKISRLFKKLQQQ